MKKISIVISLLVLISLSHAQTNNNDILYGAVQKYELMQSPFDEWFLSGYNAYEPDGVTLDALKKVNTKDLTIQIFMGTWCGDSRREVPRFLKILNEISWPEDRLKIITVGRSDSLYKQSPRGEEAGKGIFRVPVFIIYKKGVEVNRITEFPVNSLERDLSAILNGEEYESNYKSFPVVKEWLANGVLSDKNSNTRGLAMQVKPLLNNEHELNSLGYVLLRQGKKKEALRIFQVNAILYPESANVISSLGEGYLRNADTANAVINLEKAVALNRDPELLKEILKILYAAKGVKE